jgi:hypothetical protein
MWGNGTQYNFFLPMNFGFRQTVLKGIRSRKGA